jgi:hypothetical protein
MRAEEDQIVIDPEAFWQTDLKRVLEFGIYLDEYPREADIMPVLENTGTQLTGYARRWRSKIIKKNLQSEFRLFRQGANTEFEDFVLAGYAFTVLLDSPFEDLSAETLSDRFDKGTPYTLDSELKTAVKDELDKDSLDALIEFMSYGKQFDDLFAAFFGATQSTIDMRAVRERLSRREPFDVLDKLARSRINKISTRVRFDTNNKIRDIANATYDLEAVLDDLNGESRRDVMSTFTGELADVSLTSLSDSVSRLETYDDANAAMVESLKKFTRLNQRDIEDAVQAAERAETLLQRGTKQQRLQGTLITQKLSATTIYSRYTDINIVGPGSGIDGGFAEQFTKVGGYYVD